MSMYDTTLSQKNMPRIWGYAKRKIKDAHPKKVCHMLRHVKKKEKRIKDAYPKKVCHMLRHAQNKRCIPKEGMPHASACSK